MNGVGTEIDTLLNSTVKAAPEITSPLTKIGNGDMLKGLRTIFNFAMDEGFAKGEKSGMIKGSVGTIAGIGIVYVGYKGVQYVRDQMVIKKAHQSEGKVILENLEESVEANSEI